MNFCITFSFLFRKFDKIQFLVARAPPSGQGPKNSKRIRSEHKPNLFGALGPPKNRIWIFANKTCDFLVFFWFLSRGTLKSNSSHKKKYHGLIFQLRISKLTFMWVPRIPGPLWFCDHLFFTTRWSRLSKKIRWFSGPMMR